MKKMNIIITILILFGLSALIFTMGVIGPFDIIQRQDLEIVNYENSPVNIQYLKPNIIFEFVDDLPLNIINPFSPYQDYLKNGYLCNLVITARPPTGKTRIGISYLKITLHSEYDENNIHEQFESNILYTTNSTLPRFVNQQLWTLEEIVARKNDFIRLKNAEYVNSESPEYTVGTLLLGARRKGIIVVEVEVSTYKKDKKHSYLLKPKGILGKAVAIIHVNPDLGPPVDPGAVVE